MAKEGVGAKLNRLSEVVVQLALHQKTQASLLVEGSQPIQDHLQQLADIAAQCVDKRNEQYDFSPTIPGEKESA